LLVLLLITKWYQKQENKLENDDLLPLVTSSLKGNPKGEGKKEGMQMK
jgi:hypothetical protein